MNKQMILPIAIVLVVCGFFFLNIVFKNHEIIPIKIIPIKANQNDSNKTNWLSINNSFLFNNSNCNENNTRTSYESKKIDGSWQITTVMTCLNETVRIIPV